MRLLFLLLSFTIASAVLAQAPAPEDRVKAQQERAVTQPGNNAPVWREVRGGGSPYTTTTVKGRATCLSSPGATRGGASATAR
jgi:hypothetical protein